MKERRGRRDKNGFANDPVSKKSYNGPVPSIFRKLLSRSLWYRTESSGHLTQ